MVVKYEAGVRNKAFCFPVTLRSGHGGASVKEPTFQCRRCKRLGYDPWIRKVPWRKKWQPTPVFLPGKSLGQRSLAGYSP